MRRKSRAECISRYPSNLAQRVFSCYTPESLNLGESLEIEHVIDFIPGLTPYSNRMRVDFDHDGGRARMTIEVEPHPTPEWTRMSAMGMESQLTKVPAALAAR